MKEFFVFVFCLATFLPKSVTGNTCCVKVRPCALQYVAFMCMGVYSPPNVREYIFMLRKECVQIQQMCVYVIQYECLGEYAFTHTSTRAFICISKAFYLHFLHILCVCVCV